MVWLFIVWELTDDAADEGIKLEFIDSDILIINIQIFVGTPLPQNIFN